MIKIEVSGFRELAKEAEKLAQMFEREQAMMQATRKSIKYLAQKAHAKINNGENNTPHNRTGHLGRTILDFSDKMANDAKAENGSIFSGFGSDAPYAAILELGGTIPAHTIRNAWGRGIVANIPAQHRAAHPYLFPTLIENIDYCLNFYKQAWIQATGDK